MNGEYPMVVHVGYGKTATTWLQERIFGQLDSGVYLGKRLNDFPRWILEINYLDDATYRARLDDLRKIARGHQSSKHVTVLSSEAFTNLGVVHSQALRIKQVFENPKIVLVLRHPVEWMVSNYKYCVEHEGFFSHLEDYLDWGERRTPFALEKRPPFYLPDFYYDEVVSTYRNLFGRDHVLILRYEDFKENPKEFGCRLSDFIGLDLPSFEERARHKVLESPDDHRVEEQRLQNLLKVVRRGLAGKGLNDSWSPIASAVERPILLPETEERLRCSFRPHCAEFYRDL